MGFFKYGYEPNAALPYLSYCHEITKGRTFLDASRLSGCMVSCLFLFFEFFRPDSSWLI